jgi:hypothetical protein
VIEGELERPPIDDPLCGFGIVAGGRDRRARQSGEESNARRMPARVAARIRVDADEPERAELNSDLLAHLPAASRLHRLPDIDESARKCESAFERLILPADEEHAAVPVIDDAIDRERWRFRQTHAASIAPLPAGCGPERP